MDYQRFQANSPMLKSGALDGILVFPLVDWLTHQMAPACPPRHTIPAKSMPQGTSITFGTPQSTWAELWILYFLL